VGNEFAHWPILRRNCPLRLLENPKIPMEISEYFQKIMRPPWNYILAALAFVLGLVPRVLELGSGWQDIRSGRKQLEDERQRLELLKLRYEIEALKAEHSLPTLEPSPAKPATVIQAARRESDRRPIPLWQRAYPRVTGAVLIVLQVLTGVFAGMFALLAIFSPFWRTSKDGQVTISVTEAVVFDGIFILLTWGFIVLNRSLGRRRKHLLAASTPLAPAAMPSS
jgi:hypothetical protein